MTNVGVYMRLSLSDSDLGYDNKDESNSIETQRLLIRSYIEKKEELVRNIVRNLPSPCDEILWGYYRDGYSMKTLAEKFDYASETSAKVTKHRCCEKFRFRFNEMVKSLF